MSFVGRGFAFYLMLVASLSSAVPAHSYTLTQTQSGNKIRWRYGQKFFLAGNSTNQSGLSSESIWQSVVNGLQQWNRASGGLFEFDYWQGQDSSIHESSLAQNGLNSIFFASNSNEKTDPNVIGYTQVWFNTENGNMIEADIILNDRDYTLTDQAADTSSHANGEKRRVYLNNVVTHELGHAAGLSHSNSINSSMLYVEFSEQYKLGCDDWSAAKHLYYNDHNRMGSMGGRIVSPRGEAVAGAVVTAISITRGVPIAAVHTDQNGKYDFGALEPGNYSLMVESYEGGENSVPVRLRSNRKCMVCEQNIFPKNFVVGEDRHTLMKFSVRPGMQTDAGTYQLRCSEVPDSSSSLTENTPDVFVDRGGTGTSKTYRFNARGPFQITGLGYLLLSPIRVSLTVTDSAGNPIEAQSQSPMYQSKISGFKIDDSSVIGTAFGPVTVRVDVSPQDASGFPTPAVWPSKSPYYVIIFNPDVATGVKGLLPDNPRCSSNEAFASYQSPPGNPIRFSTVTTTRDGIGFCGNANAASFRESGRAPVRHETTFGSILGWIFPLMVAIACQLFLRKRRAKL